MFLSTRGGSVYEEQCGSQVQKVALGGETPWITGGTEMQRGMMISPGGVRWCPVAGQNVLVMKNGGLGEENCIVGVCQTESGELEPGEIQLFAKTASITLKNDGRILLKGRVFVNGEVLSSAT